MRIELYVKGNYAAEFHVKMPNGRVVTSPPIEFQPSRFPGRATVRVEEIQPALDQLMENVKYYYNLDRLREWQEEEARQKHIDAADSE